MKFISPLFVFMNALLFIGVASASEPSTTRKPIKQVSYAANEEEIGRLLIVKTIRESYFKAANSVVETDSGAYPVHGVHRGQPGSIVYIVYGHTTWWTRSPDLLCSIHDDERISCSQIAWSGF